MKRINNSGQEAIEFVLISSLVFIAALGTVLLFGNKLASFFSGATVANTAVQSAPLIGSSGGGQFTPSYQTNMPDEAKAENIENKEIDGVKITYNSDGSVYFNVEGQDVNIPSSAMSMIDETFRYIDTAGSAGKEEALRALIKLIKEEKDNYPNEDVPVEIAGGDSIRFDNLDGGDDQARVMGKAEINITNLRVGDRMITFVNDIKAERTEGDAENITTQYNGTFMIEGNYYKSGYLTEDKEYKADRDFLDRGLEEFSGYYGTVTSLNGDTAGMETGKFLQESYKPGDGINIGGGKYLQASSGSRSGFFYSDWTLDFSDAQKKYNL